MRRAWPLVILAGALSAPACQCFVPVEEGPGNDGGHVDAGESRDGGAPDAGSSDGGIRACASPLDCSGPIAVTRACAMTGASDAGFSCIQGLCIPECAPPAGRTCTWGSASHCLTCSAQDCVTDCQAGFFPGLSVEGIACSSGAAPWPAMTRFDVVRDAGVAACDYALQDVLFGEVGRVRFLGSSQVQADLPALGGLCVGEWLPTNAARIVLSCPRCQVVFLGN